MKEESEEGIGTGINIIHHAPALLGQAICFTATLTAIERNEVHTQFDAHEGTRLIASGTQTQKIINKEKLERLFQAIANGA
jgi:predicted thioesterase